MRIIVAVAFVICYCSCAVKPASIEGRKVATSPQLFTDRFDNVYILKVNGELDMYNANRELLFTYANNSLGNVSHVDVTNPQNIVAFVQDFNTIAVLDNTLAELTTIDLASLEYPEITMAATSNDGNYWIYDQANWRLVKIDRVGNEINQSNRLTDYNLAQFTPVYMLERDNKVYISTSTEQLLIFDNFGQFIKSIPMPGLTKFSYEAGRIYYLSEGDVVSYDLKYLTVAQEAIEEVEHEQLVDMVKIKHGFMFLTDSGNYIKRMDH